MFKNIAVAAIISVLPGIVAPASATVYYEKQAKSPYIACFNREYVPATVRVNTRGVLVQREHVGWQVTGERWDRVRSPGVYIQTERTVEQDHYKLVPTACH